MTTKPPHRIYAKLYAREPVAVRVAELVPVFHGWIQRQEHEELLIDVHNYAHVHEGPGILLIGHEGDYALDASRGRAGILYRRKRTLPGALQDALVLVMRKVIAGAVLLEREPALEGRLRFRTDEVEIGFPDRLGFPNTRQTFDRLRSDLEAAARFVYGVSAAQLTWIDEDSRQPLSIHIAIPGAEGPDELARRADVGATLVS